ncbi:MAG: glycosyltransferase, partial [Oscillospiraceae bacterium]|nr:glycosyltransferase [Oscillospiraceae bacterium]
IGFIFTIVTIIRKLVRPDVPMGYSSLMSVLLFVGGLLMVILGLIGEYIGRIYININNSPQYVIREEINTKHDERDKVE